MTVPVTTATVAIMALITCLATGLGALPLLAVRDMPARQIGLANAVAAGFMIAASGVLVHEGLPYGVGIVAGGFAVGVLFVAISRAALSGREDLHIGALRGADALRALLIVGIMTLHSVTEGIGVGVGFGGGEELGLFLTIAIAVHNIPEGMAISLVLVPGGTPVWKAALWSIFTSVPQPILAVPAFLAVEAFRPLLPAGLGFATGAMIWMSVRELLPEAFAVAPRCQVAGVTCASVAAMLLFQMLLKG